MALSKANIRRIYALGAGLGIVDHDNKDDDLHALVSSVTGKTSVSDLTDKEYADVEHALFERMRGRNRQPNASGTTSSGASRHLPQGEGSKGSDTVPGMMNKAQQGKAWRYVYRLIELGDGDKSKSGNRMLGAIKKILGKDGSLKEPFRFVSFDEGEKLIEQLKRYVLSAERKVKKQEAV